MYWGLGGTLHTQGPEEYRGHWGTPRVRGHFGGVRGHQGCIGAGRDSRYSGARRV